MTVTLKEFTGGAAATALSGGITSSSTSIGVSDGSTFPTGATAPFVICIDRGTASEEKILCASRTSNTFTVTTRGYDGTSAASHANGATLEHVLDATTISEVNKAAAQTIGKITAANQLLASSGSEAFSALTVAASRFVGRKATGDIAAMTAAESKTLLAIVKADISDLGTIPTTAVFYTTHTWTIDTPAVESGDTDLIIPMTVAKASGDVITIERVEHKINSGTSVTWDLTVNGSGATGFTSLSSTTTTTNTDPANVSLADRDKVKPDVSAVTGTPKKWEVTVTLKHTVTLS